MYYIGLDVHKKDISYCIKQAGGELHGEGRVEATRPALDAWLRGLPQPWTGALEATLFSGWIYDHLRPHASALKVAHPAMLRAIAASKKKNDQVDARKIADLLRCDLLPECYMAPSWFRERRRTLRYRHLLVRQSVQMKNRMAGLLMETGVAYNKQKLHKKRYFAQLRASKEVPASIQPLLKIGRETVERIARLDRTLLQTLERDPALTARVERLQTIPGIGPVTALTWVLEIAEVGRFSSLKQAVSYCGLCSAERSSAGIQKRSPISKQRNQHLQTVLIEAAKVAPRWNAELALLHEKSPGERESQSRHAGGGPQTGGLSAGGGSPRNAVSARKGISGGLAAPLTKCMDVDRHLPGLAELGAQRTEETPGGCLQAVSRLAGNHNSIFGEGVFFQKIPETANGCLVPRTAGTAAERQSGDLLTVLDSPKAALPARRWSNSVCPLDFTYHRCLSFPSFSLIFPPPFAIHGVQQPQQIGYSA